MLRNVCKASFLILFFTTACATDEQPKLVDNQSNNSTAPENKEINTVEGEEVLADNLNVPWSIEKLGDTFYLTERPGNIVKIENGQVERQEVELEKQLATAAEAGLLGFVLDQNFTESHQAYAYYTYEDEQGQFNRMVTLRLDGGSWKEQEVLLDQIPSGAFHHGGRLKIGPDDKLYATAGDASHPDIAQDQESLGGKILRMNVDGTIPNDNPFENSYVYSLGHRNPQGLTWTENGTLYASEHGESANDEINKIVAGENYGWPIIEGEEEAADMITPLFISGSDHTWAPSGIDYKDNMLYVSTLRGTELLRFDIDSGEESTVISDLGRLRDVLIDNDAIYVITNNTDGRGSPEDADDILFKMPLSNTE